MSYGKFEGLAKSIPDSQPVNPVRGCGTLKRGGCYLRSNSAVGGTLRRLVWVLGTHVFNSGLWMKDNILVDAPPRSMVYINPAETLVRGEIVYAGGQDNNRDLPDLTEEEDDLYWRLLAAVGSFGILDHVGSSYYPTPFDFSEEVWQYGPSRKVPEQMLRFLSENRMFPIPVFFTHSRMPFFAATSMRNHIFEIACENAQEDHEDPAWDFGPTWYKAGRGWGMQVSDKDAGGNHYLIPILKGLSQLSAGPAAAAFDEAERTDGLYYESMFLASWFTEGAYVLEDENDPGAFGPGLVNIDLDKERIFDASK